MNAPSIKISNLTQVYDDFTAVRNLSLTVESGQILGLLGPNGAGKTTTLKVVAGILQPTEGRVELGGYDLMRDPLTTRRITGFIPDSPSAMGFLTVWEHITLYAALYQLKQYKSFADHLLKEFDLDDKKNKTAKELSLGMRQKLSICCNYLVSPRILLFDEPLTGLDPRGIHTLENSIREQAANGVTIILSSHLLSILQNLCTHVSIIQSGESLFFGSMSELLDRSQRDEGNASLEEAFFQVTQSHG